MSAVQAASVAVLSAIIRKSSTAPLFVILEN